MKKIKILGIGNPILQDDGVGLHVVERLRKQLNDANIALDVAYTGGLNLLDSIRGFDKVILIDAIKQVNSRVGEVKRFPMEQAEALHSSNPHDVSLSDALLLASQLGETQLPVEIIVIGIVVKNITEFGEHLSQEVAAAVPSAVSLVFEELKNT
jgi:hydrogenase maturation protease